MTEDDSPLPDELVAELDAARIRWITSGGSRRTWALMRAKLIEAAGMDPDAERDGPLRVTWLEP